MDAGSLGTLLIGVAAFLTSVTGMVGQIRNWRGGGKTKSGGQPATPEVVTEAAAVVIEHQREGRHEQQG